MATKQQVAKYAAQSAFIFKGKVLKSKATTIPNIPTDDTAIVHVDEVLTSPPMFAALQGQDITVRFKKPGEIRAGRTMTFFTNGWIFGSSIAVDAVGYVSETDKEGLAPFVQAGFMAKNNDVLSTRLDSAEMVVAGKVEKVQKSAEGTTHISEHDPNWHEATINIDEVVKGEKRAKKAAVLFPKSDDIRWYKIPKYQEGQQGVWLLQPGKKQEPKGIAPKVLAAVPDSDVLTTLHASDFLPLSELGRVKSLLGK
jgi:hypothetical protein